MPYFSGVDESGTVMFGRAAAQDPHTRPARLARLARSGNPELRALVARNASTPPSALAALAGDSVLGIVATVAGNPATPKLRSSVSRKAGMSMFEPPHLGTQARLVLSSGTYSTAGEPLSRRRLLRLVILRHR